MAHKYTGRLHGRVATYAALHDGMRDTSKYSIRAVALRNTILSRWHGGIGGEIDATLALPKADFVRHWTRRKHIPLFPRYEPWVDWLEGRGRKRKPI